MGQAYSDPKRASIPHALPDVEVWCDRVSVVSCRCGDYDVPFDSAYKLMATFHRITDERGRDVVRAFVKGAPDQLLARGTSALDPETLETIPGTEDLRDRYLAENEHR